MNEVEQKAVSLATLANATEIASSVIEKIAGNEISNHVDGKPVRHADLTDTIAAKFQSHLSKYLPA